MEEKTINRDANDFLSAQDTSSYLDKLLEDKEPSRLDLFLSEKTNTRLDDFLNGTESTKLDDFLNDTKTTKLDEFLEYKIEKPTETIEPPTENIYEDVANIVFNSNLSVKSRTKRVKDKLKSKGTNTKSVLSWIYSYIIVPVLITVAVTLVIAIAIYLGYAALFGSTIAAFFQFLINWGVMYLPASAITSLTGISISGATHVSLSVLIAGAKTNRYLKRKLESKITIKYAEGVFKRLGISNETTTEGLIKNTIGGLVSGGLNLFMIGFTVQNILFSVAPTVVPAIGIYGYRAYKNRKTVSSTNKKSSRPSKSVGISEDDLSRVSGLIVEESDKLLSNVAGHILEPSEDGLVYERIVEDIKDADDRCYKEIKKISPDSKISSLDKQLYASENVQMYKERLNARKDRIDKIKEIYKQDKLNPALFNPDRISRKHKRLLNTKITLEEAKNLGYELYNLEKEVKELERNIETIEAILQEKKINVSESPKVEKVAPRREPNKIFNQQKIDTKEPSIINRILEHKMLLTAGAMTAAVITVAYTNDTTAFNQLFNSVLKDSIPNAGGKIASLSFDALKWVGESPKAKSFIVGRIFQYIGVNGLIDAFANKLTSDQKVEIRKLSHALRYEKDKTIANKISEQILGIITGGSYFQPSDLKKKSTGELRELYKYFHPDDRKTNSYTKDQLLDLIVVEQYNRIKTLSVLFNNATKTFLKETVAHATASALTDFASSDLLNDLLKARSELENDNNDIDQILEGGQLEQDAIVNEELEKIGERFTTEQEEIEIETPTEDINPQELLVEPSENANPPELEIEPEEVGLRIDAGDIQAEKLEHRRIMREAARATAQAGSEARKAGIAARHAMKIRDEKLEHNKLMREVAKATARAGSEARKAGIAARKAIKDAEQAALDVEEAAKEAAKQARIAARKMSHGDAVSKIPDKLRARKARNIDLIKDLDDAIADIVTNPIDPKIRESLQQETATIISRPGSGVASVLPSTETIMPEQAKEAMDYTFTPLIDHLNKKAIDTVGSGGLYYLIPGLGQYEAGATIANTALDVAETTKDAYKIIDMVRQIHGGSENFIIESAVSARTDSLLKLRLPTIGTLTDIIKANVVGERKIAVSDAVERLLKDQIIEGWSAETLNTKIVELFLTGGDVKAIGEEATQSLGEKLLNDFATKVGAEGWKELGKVIAKGASESQFKVG
jgi:hypothetical protein